MLSLVLTLGHNSSAVLVLDGRILCGYEEERLTGKKSDSSFPKLSILEIGKHFRLEAVESLCIGHWFIDGSIPHQSKYFDLQFIRDILPQIDDDKIHSIDLNSGEEPFTHHTSHYLAAKAFAGDEFAKDSICIVADGFGTMGEVLTIFSEDGKVLDKVFGFTNSLGLLYQYTTNFLGLKMNNHEYKLLGFEAHISEVNVRLEELEELAHDLSEAYFYSYKHPTIHKKADPTIYPTALDFTMDKVESTLSSILDDFESYNLSELHTKYLLAFVVQRTVELSMVKIVVDLIAKYKPSRLILSGGLFLNVKLNHIIQESTNTPICVYPLAGDQGAGLGVYEHYFGNLKINSVCVGKRDLSIDSLPEEQKHKFVKPDNLSDAIISGLVKNGFVHLLRKNMEFGPRALCNTSTLAIPSEFIAKELNRINDRTNEMPFALVMTEKQAYNLFKDVDKVHRSLEFMVCVRTLKSTVDPVSILGGLLHYPQTGEYTCRIQITKDPELVSVLESTGPLINTSFNYHGKPIVFDLNSAIETLDSQVENHGSNVTKILLG